MSISSSKHINVAARMAHWSGRHRKKAIWGWLAFVVIVFMVGNNVVGTTQISDVDQLSGEAHEAEVALDRAGLRPVEEVVFIQSDKLTVEDPEFQAAVTDVTGRLSKVPYVENVQSPLTGDSEVSADGHAALVGFEIRGDSTRGQGACRSRSRRGRRRPGRASGPGRRAVRRRQRQQGRQRDHHRGPQEGGGALPADHADHPHHHLRHAGGGRVAAADGDHRGDRRTRPGRDPERAPAGRRQPVGGHPADRSRGRRRLLALLSATRARGARRRAQRARPRWRPPRRPPGAPC